MYTYHRTAGESHTVRSNDFDVMKWNRCGIVRKDPQAEKTDSPKFHVARRMSKSCCLKFFMRLGPQYMRSKYRDTTAIGSQAFSFIQSCMAFLSNAFSYVNMKGSMRG